MPNEPMIQTPKDFGRQQHHPTFLGSEYSSEGKDGSADNSACRDHT